jgi:hypothetical protein
MNKLYEKKKKKTDKIIKKTYGDVDFNVIIHKPIG